MNRIRIPIPESQHEGLDSNPYGVDLNLNSRKGQKDLLEVVDSNLYGLDSNLDSKEVCSDNQIRISIKQIRIPCEEEKETKAMDSNPRKKDSNPFEDLSSTSERGKKFDLNPIYNDLNLGIQRCEERMKNLNPRKKNSNPIYRMKLMAEDQAERL